MQKRTIRQLSGLDQSNQNILNMSDFSKLATTQNVFEKRLIDDLQKQLKEKHSYMLTKSSLPILSLYFEYFALLKKVITQKSIKKKKGNRFVKDLYHYYAEEKVSQLLHQITNKNKLFRKQATLYRSECLLKYFELQKFDQGREAIVKEIFNKIVQGKAEGNIKYEVKRSKKRQPTIFPLLEKDHKVRHFEFYSTLQTRKNMLDRQAQVHYQILALKMLLKNENPDPLETNKVCEQIKSELQLLFNSIKLKIVDTMEKSPRKKNYVR